MTSFISNHLLLLLLLLLLAFFQSTVTAQQAVPHSEPIPFHVGISVSPDVLANETCSELEREFMKEKVRQYTTALARLFFKDPSWTMVLSSSDETTDSSSTTATTTDMVELDASNFAREAFVDFNTYEADKFTDAVEAGNITTIAKVIIPNETVTVTTRVVQIDADDDGTTTTDTATATATTATATATATDNNDDIPAAPPTDFKNAPVATTTTTAPTTAPTPPSGPHIVKFILVDAKYNYLDDLTDSVYLADLPQVFSIVAVTEPESLKGDARVRFLMNGNVEMSPPYALTKHDPDTNDLLSVANTCELLMAGMDVHFAAEVIEMNTYAKKYPGLAIDFHVYEGHEPSMVAPVVAPFFSNAPASPVYTGTYSPVVVRDRGDGIISGGAKIGPAPTTPVATDAPTTVAPVTDAPVTKAPITISPTTVAPITDAPITKAPITISPTTVAPVTDAPITPAPITISPTTVAPVTDAPVTPAPITISPTTVAPVTDAPVTPAPGPHVVRLELFDTSNGEKIRTLADGDQLYLHDLPDDMTIVAITSPDDLYRTKVVFYKNGGTATHSESRTPYAMNGDDLGLVTGVINYFPDPLLKVPGTGIEFKAVPVRYSDSLDAYPSAAVTIDIIDGSASTPIVEKFLLVDTITGATIQDLNDGDDIYLGDVPSADHLTIVAVTVPAQVTTAVQFILNDKLVRGEATAPYSMGGDIDKTGELRSASSMIAVPGSKHLEGTVRDVESSDLTIQFNVFEGNAPVAVDVGRSAAPAPCTPTCVTIDFDTLPDGTPIQRGAYISDEWHDAYGMMISVASTDGNAYMPPKVPGSDIRQGRIFDTANPEQDLDLGSPNQGCGGPGVGAGGSPSSDQANCEALGNILIIQKGDKTAPDDVYKGGEFRFTFDTPVALQSIGLMEIQLHTVEIKIFFSDGSTKTKKPVAGGENNVQSVDIAEDDVVKAIVYIYEGAAVTHIDFCVPLCSNNEATNGRNLLTERGRRQFVTIDDNADMLMLGDDSVDQHRELIDWPRYRWGVGGNYICRYCTGDYEDGRRRNLQDTAPMSDEHKKFLVAALETVISFGLSMDLKWEIQDWLAQNGEEYGCFGTGEDLRVVFELTDP